MEDYKFSGNSHVQSRSPVEFVPSSASSSLYHNNTSSNLTNLVSTYQKTDKLKMQDDSLNGKLSVLPPNNIQLNTDSNEDHSQIEDGGSAVSLGNGVANDTSDDQHHDISAISSFQLPAYNASEPSLNSVINSNNPTIGSSSLWQNSVNDNLNIPSVNGGIGFQNYSPAIENVQYDVNLVNQSGLSSQIQPQRRPHNSNNFSHLARNVPTQAATHQQNMYIANKGYTNSWSASQNMWPTPIQNQNNLTGMSSWNRGRSVPNMNPMQNMPNRKLSPSFPHQQQANMLMPQKNFRRSTSFSGKNVFAQANCYDVSTVEDTSEMILPQYQDRSNINNGNAFGNSSLDNMQTLQQYLNDLMRTSGSDLNNDAATSASKGSNYINTNMRTVNQIGNDRSPFFPSLDEHVAASIMEDPSAHIVDGHVYLGSINSPTHSPLPLNADKDEKYSRKVFVGGLPPDIDEDEISASFRRFGPLVVDWPHKAESKSYFPPKGYAFLLFQEEMSVQQLIDACIQEDDKLYLVVSSPTVKDKAVQIRPWRLTDADFVLNASMPLDPRKTVFVGGVPRPLKAFELATIMDRLYGCVCYAGIDTDPELKYPKGAGRVAFSNQQSYIAAISARFVQLQHADIDKRVEVKPYVLDDQMCDECAGQLCGGKFAPFFCANVTCLQYYCEHCWSKIHSRSGREFHKPLVKEGADRPRTLQQYRWC